MTSKLVLSALSLLLFACSHTRPEAIADCRLRAIPMYVGTTHPREIAGPGAAPAVVEVPPSPLQHFMTNVLVQAPRDPSQARAPGEVLVLSGGSQHGLFGTGFFLGLPSVPTY